MHVQKIFTTLNIFLLKRVFIWSQILKSFQNPACVFDMFLLSYLCLMWLHKILLNNLPKRFYKV